MRGMRRYRVCALVVLVVGCATAGKEHGGNPGADARNGGGDGPQSIDAPNQRIDAPMASPDAAVMATLTDTTNSQLAFGSGCCSVACSVTATGNTRDNTWYRAFQLGDFPMVAGGFHVTSVAIGIQEAKTSMPITVKIGTYAGALDGATIDAAMITPLAMATATPPDTNGPPGGTLAVPVVADLPAGAKFVVQVVAPDMQNTGYFYLGATKSGERHSGYISSAACNVTTPQKTTMAAPAAGQIVIDVLGTH